MFIRVHETCACICETFDINVDLVHIVVIHGAGKSAETFRLVFFSFFNTLQTFLSRLKHVIHNRNSTEFTVNGN